MNENNKATSRIHRTLSHRIANSALVCMFVAAAFTSTGCAAGSFEEDEADYDQTTQAADDYAQLQEPGDTFRGVDHAYETGDQYAQAEDLEIGNNDLQADWHEYEGDEPELSDPNFRPTHQGHLNEVSPGGKVVPGPDPE